MKSINLMGKQLILSFGLLFTLLFAVNCREKNAPPYSIGADISFIPQTEARGGTTYTDTKGEIKDICQIMADHHFDNIRLRLFVNPEAERGYSKNGFCGLEETVKMARRIKNAGMKFTLNFHHTK